MKAYGLPRNDDVANPDIADIKRFGLSTPDRCSRADRGKNEARRFWKKKARNEGARELARALVNA